MISLDGVCVPTADRDFLSFAAYDHQAKSEDVITTRDSFFAVNESPTGSGKTLSWLKPALDERIDTIAVFPTNALIADQVTTAKSIVQKHYADDRIDLVPATGETIAQWRSEYDVVSKGEALARRIDKSLVTHDTTVLFTNPDTLVLVRKQMYRHRFVRNKFDRFQMVVLDEFHLADVKQRDSLLFLIDEMFELPENQSRTNRFYFLSATPEDDDGSGRNLLTRLREDVGESPVQISAERRPISSVTSSRWRPVMPAVDLSLRESQTFRTADELLDDETIEEFIEFCQNGQTVVMLDGVHEVDRVYEELDEGLDQIVRRITGFHKGDVESKIEDFDVLVSNSAVEVGLDFQPEQVVFSAHTAATLIQRLGRLRADTDRSDTYQAWCYVPGSVRARLEADFPQNTTQRIPRTDFEQTVHTAFTNECDLSSFSRRWGELEAFQHVMQQVDETPSDAGREEILDRGIDRIEQHYYKPYNRSFNKDDLRRLHKWTDHNVIDELKSYRGSGLQVMVRDHTDSTTSMKLYDIFYLLRWGKVEFMPAERFSSRLSSSELEFFDAYSSYAVGFCEYYGKISTEKTDSEEYPGRSVVLHAESRDLHRMSNTPDAQRKPEVVDGITVRIDNGHAPPIEGIDYLRDKMVDAKRLCYVVPGRTSSIKSMYGLGEFFFVYPLGDNSIAIGLNALYLHCLVKDHLESQERDWGWE